MDTLATLLSQPGAPGLVHVHHPHHTPSALAFNLPDRCVIARLDAVEHHTPRLLYAGILARLDDEGEGKEVISWDVFARDLRIAWRARVRRSMVKGKGKGKAREADVEDEEEGGDEDEGQAVIVVTKAERLRTVLGASWSAFTRLPELVSCYYAIQLTSGRHPRDRRALLADAVGRLATTTRRRTGADPHVPRTITERGYGNYAKFMLTFSEILGLLASGSDHPLYPRFLDLLIATFGSLAPTSPPSEIEYVASSLWPIYTAALPPHAEMTLLGRAYPDAANPPPPLDLSVRLLAELKHQLSLALAAATESVLPRTAGRSEFTRALMPFGADGAPRHASQRVVPRPPPLELPLAAKFLLVAAYCASYNPVKSDVRLFGRGTGPDGRRRRGGGTRRAGYGRTRVGKVPQRLLGPRPFPLDRLLAMFASLYAEHAVRPHELDASDDEDADPFASPAAATRRRERQIARDDVWEDHVDHLAFSTRLWALIPELEAQGLVRRASPVDRLDNVMLRCEVDYETTKSVAKEIRVVLDEYLYEAVV
jgi:origin recognition complex subunit 5